MQKRRKIMEHKKKKSVTSMDLTIPIVILMFLTSLFGMFDATVYEKETRNWIAQCLGQDFSNLLCVIPLLLFTFYFSKKGYRFAKIIWIGTMITNIYAYVIYCFSVHFNFLFHAYCAILGLAFFSAIGYIIENSCIDFKSWFHIPMKRRKFYAVFLLLVASLFLLLWLSQTLPASVTNTLPQSAVESGLITNPVYVLDFSFYIPLMVIAAIFLLKDRSEGYVLVPIMLVFAVITNINIISLTLVSIFRNHTKDSSVLVIFVIFTIICLTVVCLYSKKLKR